MSQYTEKFFQISLDLMVIGTPSGHFLRFSPSWTRVLGWTEEELKQATFHQFIHPDDLGKTQEVIQKAIAGSPIEDFENRYRHKNGTWRNLLWSGVFSKDDQMIYAVARDVTQIKEFESQLQRSQNRLNAAQKIAKIGSWELDLSNFENVESNPLHWSDQVFRIFGYEPHEIAVSNENFFKGVHPDDRWKIRQAVADAFETGKDYDVEHRVVWPDGTERIVHELSQVEFDKESGRAISMSGTVQDITEQKKLMEQLMTSQKLESIGRLAGGIAHDFNNLLAAIYGNLELVAKELPEQSPASRYLKNVRSTAQRAADLTKQLLAFSRQQILSPTVQDLNELVREAHKILARLLGKDIEFCLSLDTGIPSVEVDASQIIQIILNLAINSRDAMPTGGTLKVETFERSISYSQRPRADVKAGRYVGLKVTDTGHGMDATTIEKVFEPFFSTKTPDAGTGLGLSTVYGIVQQSGGFIFVESQLGQGSSFEIILPATDKLKAAMPKVGDFKAPTTSKKGQRILLVEDETELRLALIEFLSDAGYKVNSVENGQQAMQYIQGNFADIDLMISDVVLPGANGFDLAVFLRDLKPKTPVICMSGHPLKSLHKPHTISGVRFMQKPFEFSQLLEILDKGDLENS